MGEEEEREKKSDEIATHAEIPEVREPNACILHTPPQILDRERSCDKRTDEIAETGEKL